MEAPTLTGVHVRLEPLDAHHTDALVEAANEDREFYRWSFVPRSRDEVAAYIEHATRLRADGRAVPFAIVRTSDSRAIGSTRFFDLERWNWPRDHARASRAEPDVAEIGYTWLGASSIRTAANTEAKLLLLTHAFEEWDALRICFHTDRRNERSGKALDKIGAQFEGVLRGHRLGVDFQPRDSFRYSITAPDWPRVKEALTVRLNRA